MLQALQADTAEKISALCDISLTAAGFRAERMELLNGRKKFFTSSGTKSIPAIPVVYY